MGKTFILKLGALGDVLRTTSLLHVLPEGVTWVTSVKAAPLLEDNHLIERLCLMEDLDAGIIEGPYDAIINLEDMIAAAQVATQVRAARRFGPY